MARRKKQTVGYKYYAGMHLVFCHGPIDRVNEYYIDEDKKHLATGLSTNGSITVNKPNLFGGERSQGGVSGTFDQELGGPTQTKNSYLLSKLGALVSAHRGVVGAVLRQMYLGMSPYLKRIGINATRIHTTTREGTLQWYDEKAAILRRESSGYDTPITFGYLAMAEAVFAPASFPQFDPFTPGYATWPTNFGQTIDVGNFQFSKDLVATTVWSAQVVTMPFDSGWTLEFLAQNENSTLGTNSFSMKFEFLSATGTVLFVIECTSNVEGTMPLLYGTPGNMTSAPVGTGTFQYCFGTLTFTPTGVAFEEGNTSPFVGVQDWSAEFDVLSCTQLRITTGPAVFNPTGNPAGYEGGGWMRVASRSTSLTAIYDMNPAHIIRECLTDTDWGMGYAEADIDDAAFRAAADTLYAEGMGISLLWDTQSSIEDFVNLICKHIDASIYVDRRTGLFVLKLIRDDYNVNDLLQLGVSNVISITDLNKPTFGELVNSVTVTYWDGLVRGNGTVTVSDIALAAAQGATVSAAIEYPGFTIGTLAARVAQRDLLALSSPRISCTVLANTVAKDLKPGECFRLTWPDLEIDDAVMRITGIAFGDGKSNQVRITCTEDVYSLPDEAVIAEPPDPVDPSTGEDPEPATLRMAMEMPYWEAAQRYDQIDVDDKLADNPDAGFVLVAAARPTTNSINAQLWTDAGAGYVETADPVDFCPHAVLDGALDRLTTLVPIASPTEVTSDVVDTWILVDEEIMQVVDWDEGYSLLTVRRGCLDTVPVVHADGATVLFVDDYSGTDDTEYNTGESIGVKLLPRTPTASVELADAPEDVVTMAHRANRPYGPANVQFNGEYWPVGVDAVSLDLTWVGRNRTAQTGATMLDWYDAGIAVEAGVVFAVRILDASDDSVIYESLQINGLSHSVAAGLITVASIKVQLYARRDIDSSGGYESWQIVEHELLFGTSLVTESAENILTEDGQEIFAEG